MDHIKKMDKFLVGDRVQLRINPQAKGTIIRKALGGLLCVRFDRAIPQAGNHRQWLCDPCEIEPSMVCRVDGRVIGVYPEKAVSP